MRVSLLPQYFSWAGSKRQLPRRTDEMAIVSIPRQSTQVSLGHVGSCWLLVPGCKSLSETQTQLYLAPVLSVDIVDPFHAIANY